MPTKSQLQDKINSLERLLTVVETDNNFVTYQTLQGYYTNRANWDRSKVFDECIKAWRLNPLARKITKLFHQFIIGKGIKISTEHKATQRFIDSWLNDVLNQIPQNYNRWMDERTLTGNNFMLFNVDTAGMSYLRAVPADLIKDIQTAPNDIEQERYYIPHDPNAETWAAFDLTQPQDKFIKHYSINRPVGTVWGEPELGPSLVWLGRFSSWLEDRVRLNRYRNAFMYDITITGKDDTKMRARKNDIMMNPPQPGSVNVHGGDEVWQVLAPELNSSDASKDGLNIKKMIASGSEFPLHYLAEPESATRTTAEAAGTPTFRGLEEMQQDFLFMVKDMVRTAVLLRSKADKRVRADAEIQAIGPDITERDNATLALAAMRALPAWGELFDRNLIDENELLRVTYKMIAENFEPDPANVGKGKKKPLVNFNAPTAGAGKQPDDEPEGDNQDE